VMTECSAQSQIPVAPLIGSRHFDVPRPDEMAVSVLNGPFHGRDRCGIGNVANFNVYRIDGEHVPEVCKSGTAGFRP